MSAVSPEVRDRLATLAGAAQSWAAQPLERFREAASPDVVSGLLADLEKLRDHLTQVLNGIDWLDEVAPPRAPSAAYANREAGLAVFRCNARDFLAEYDGATEAAP